MDGFSYGYQMIDSIVATAGTPDYKSKQKEQNKYRSEIKKKDGVLASFEETLGQEIVVHTSGYGKNAAKTEFFVQQKVYM